MAAAGARRCFCAASGRKLTGALVQSVESSLLSPNYIDSLLAARALDDDSHEIDLQPPPPTLLYLLLRHSMLLEYARCRARSC